MKFLREHLYVILIAIIAISALAVSAMMIISAFANTKPGPGLNETYVSVRFLGEDDEILLEKKVPQGAFAVPPVDIHLSGNQVMQGWYGSMLNVSSDSECRISLRDIANETNVFYINTQYVPCNETFELDVRLGGNVNLSIIELTLPYDTQSLKYESSSSRIGTVGKKDEGELYFQLNNNKTINENTVLFSVRFRAVGNPFSYVELKPNIQKAITRLANGTETTDYQIIPAKLYLYDKEVSK